MSTIEKKLEAGISKYAQHIRDNYNEFGTRPDADKFSVEVEYTRYYAKVITNQGGHRSSHSWVVLKNQGRAAKFKIGDILKSHSWNGPALNFARGNLLENHFDHIRWAGAY